jgi:hypothetical protein
MLCLVLSPSWRRSEGTDSLQAHFVAVDRLMYVKYTAAIAV